MDTNRWSKNKVADLKELWNYIYYITLTPTSKVIHLQRELDGIWEAYLLEEHTVQFLRFTGKISSSAELLPAGSKSTALWVACDIL